MEVELKTVVSVSAAKLVEEMTHTECADFCSNLAVKLNNEFHLRAEAAENFSDGLSEDGCRFLAEVIAAHYRRSKRRSDT